MRVAEKKTKNMQALLKQKKSKEKAEAEKSSESGESILSLRNRQKRKNRGGKDAYKLRLAKDLTLLEKVPGTRTAFPNEDDQTKFYIYCKPLDGLYKSAEFQFSVEIPTNYPYDAPKVTCETMIYHPNIDFEGHVCLNILRDDWRPVLNLGTVLFGLMTLFLEPNPDDPLNKEAADEMSKNPASFKRNVEKTLRGGFYFGKNFPSLR